MSRKKVLYSLLAVPLLFLLVACGGGSKKDNSSTSSNGNAATSSSGSSANSSSSSGGSSSSSSGSSSSNDGGVSLENCRQYTNLEKLAQAGFGTPGSTDFKIDKGALDQLVKASPSEIRNDMQLVVSTIEDVFDAIQKLGVNLSDPASFQKLDPAKLQQLETISNKFDDQKFEDASNRIEAYFEKNCS
ncbi:MAG TPA: hypothetical protein VFX19_11395 [Dehalococcoidia bacterium]|jgi:hypothetical protein|nr:hypothetical protein [Dehalococcoidia bacterium]